MKEKYASSQSPQVSGDPRDILARLYREIGISAVAAALEISESRPAAPNTDDAKDRAERRLDDFAA